MSGACDHPSWQPSRERPSGGCGAPAARAVPLGRTGRFLPVCGEHAGRYRQTIPLSEVPDP